MRLRIIRAPQGGGRSRNLRHGAVQRPERKGPAGSPPSAWSWKGRRGRLKCEPRTLAKSVHVPRADLPFPCPYSGL